MPLFRKTRAGAPVGFFEAEAAGLRWLADASGARIARVGLVEADAIAVERIGEANPTAAHARAFGSALAATHAAGADAFGAGPDGWAGPLFIGRRPLPRAAEATWGAFYARDRVLPYLAVAQEVGNIAPEGAAQVRRACAVIADGAFDDGEPPARLHGDLWNGNLLWSADGVVLIDPAAHGGHRETDLAMLALFGCPYLEHLLVGYTDVFPLIEGWRGRTPLHQLHPLAVHAAGHGPSYGAALHRAAQHVLDLVASP
ncbi:MAG: fructosamine-3-kinase [Glaciihabitans sp.]|nr:fructosamine-3-kinase [Glaciihabitans sp.]